MTLRDSVDVGITYSQEFAEWQAAHLANLDLWRWDEPPPVGYSLRFKAKVVAWANLHLLVENHKQDAISKAMKRKQKKS